MRRILAFPIYCAICLSCLATRAADAPDAAAEARIPFANYGGIYNWQAVNDKTLLIERQDGKWFKATLLNSCFRLPFTERVGFESNPDGSFDKFSSIQVGSQKCQVVSLVESAPPAKKGKGQKSANGAAPGKPAQP
jgi:hypothetical protein